MSVRADRFSRHSSRSSVDYAHPSVSGTAASRAQSFRSARVPRTSSDELMLPVRTLRSSSCRVTAGAPHRLRRHHSAAAECERARRARRHTLELPRGPSLQSCTPEPTTPEEAVPEPAIDEGKEARRRRVVAAVAASFFALALASVLVVVVTLTHSSVLRAHNQTANSAGERAYDARRVTGGSRQSHPVFAGSALTPRYSPRPRLDPARPPAVPALEEPHPAPEEPPETPAGVYAHPAAREAPDQEA